MFGDVLLDDVLGEVILVDKQGVDLCVRMKGAEEGNNMRRTAGHLRAAHKESFMHNKSGNFECKEDLLKEKVANHSETPAGLVDLLNSDASEDSKGGGKTFEAEATKIAHFLIKTIREQDPESLNWRYQKKEYADACSKYMNGVFAPKGFRNSVHVVARSPSNDLTGPWLTNAGLVTLARHMQLLPLSTETKMTRTLKKKENVKSFLAETVIMSEGNNNSGVQIIGLRMDDHVVLPAVFCLLLDLNISAQGEEELRIIGRGGANLLLNGPLMIVWAGAGVKSFYKASPHLVCVWEPRDEGQRALTNCLMEEFKKHSPERDAYSCLHTLALITPKWHFCWESLAGIPDVQESYISEEGRLRELSSSMELATTKADDLSFNELLALNNWRSDDLNNMLGMLDYAEDSERKQQQRKEDESARNRMKYTASTFTAWVLKDEFAKCKTVKAVNDQLEMLQGKFVQAESGGSARGFRPDQIEAAAKELQEDKKGGKALRGNHLKKDNWYKDLQSSWESVQKAAADAKARLAHANRAAKRPKSVVAPDVVEVDMEESNRSSKAAKKGSATSTTHDLHQQVVEVLRKELGESKELAKRKAATLTDELQLQVTKDQAAKVMHEKLQEENSNLKLAQERARADAVREHMEAMEAMRKQAEQDKLDKVKAEAERELWRQMVILKEATEKEKLEHTLKMHEEVKLTNQVLMENATQRAHAEGQLGLMKVLQEQHLQEQQRWQKRENLQYFMQTVNANAQGDVHPMHQAVMLHALGMSVPGNLFSSGAQGAPAGASTSSSTPHPSLMGGASTSSMPHPSLMLQPPAEADTSTMNRAYKQESSSASTMKKMSKRAVMQDLLAKWEEANQMQSSDSDE